MDVDHGQLDHVGGGSLDRRVDGVAFGGVAQGVIGGANVPQITSPAGDGFHVAMAAGKGDGVVHVFADAWKLFEILFDDDGSVSARQVQTLPETKGGNSVGDAVV